LKNFARLQRSKESYKNWQINGTVVNYVGSVGGVQIKTFSIREAN